MKIEEKAKRYDEAIMRGSRLWECDTITKESYEYIFPELIESEDEKIRKDIIYHIKNCDDTIDEDTEKRMLDWLEKQGEQKSAEWSREDEQNLNACFGYIPDEFLRRWLTDIIHVKYDKPADKVEPKFKVGDWINGYYTNYKVLSINDDGYVVEDTDGNKLNVLFENEMFHHLWTIRDAKDGDVLASNRSIFIFSQEYIAGKPEAYCGIMNGLFLMKPEGCWTNEKCYPATKEQRDTLMKAMDDAGYTFDFEQKQTFDIEIPLGAKDSELQEVSYHIPEGFHAEIEGNKVIIKKGEQNPDWSEEDCNQIETIACHLDNVGNGAMAESLLNIMNKYKSCSPHNT